MITEARIKALVAEALQTAAEEGDDAADPDIYLPLFPNDKTRKGLIGGWYVPDTNKIMFVSRAKSPEGCRGWNFTHVPTMASLFRLYLIEMPEALVVAKSCYDAGIAAGVALESKDHASIGAAWAAAICAQGLSPSEALRTLRTI